MASTKLKTARANRDLAVAPIKDIYKSAKDVESDSSLMIAFSVRLTTLDAQYKTFDKHHTSILELASSTIPPQREMNLFALKLMNVIMKYYEYRPNLLVLKLK